MRQCFHGFAVTCLHGTTHQAASRCSVPSEHDGCGQHLQLNGARLLMSSRKPEQRHAAVNCCNFPASITLLSSMKLSIMGSSRYGASSTHQHLRQIGGRLVRICVGAPAYVHGRTCILHTVCMHACMHAYIHMFHSCIHTHTYVTYIHTYIHTYIRTYIHTYTHTHTHVHSYICIYFFMYMYIHIHVCMHIYIYIYMLYVYVYVHARL